MTHTVRDLVVKAAAIKAIQTAAAAAEKEVKDHLEVALDAGDRKTAAVDGQSAATITYAKTSASARITNAAEFEAWVQANHPEEIHSVPITVDPEDLAWLVGVREVTDDQSSRDYCAAFDRLLDEVTHSRTQVSPTYVARVVSNAVADKQAVDQDTGEVIPGVTYYPGGVGTYVTVRQSEEQREVLVEAWQRGTINLVDLALTPLAELEAKA